MTEEEIAVIVAKAQAKVAAKAEEERLSNPEEVRKDLCYELVDRICEMFDLDPEDMRQVSLGPIRKGNRAFSVTLHPDILSRLLTMTNGADNVD